jgi:hypothetical protein
MRTSLHDCETAIKGFLSQEMDILCKVKVNKFIIVIINYERFDFAYEQGQNTNVCKIEEKNQYKKNS